ncbi:bifunctional diguanylate cyclase/phosphodiesterase [Homoserinibacter sp. GY 40078]|uniref:putative bifunctional diguanylate cyclase/phosphodiesterase n=1 Tax=Homoserinibacter sp. GY 40078 TaxID=2603275 RepID=UPI0011CC3D3C|nr:bifunctional diguanylate cyclase/phosphodiesterase [Homoserinibacter sp. GY 40078]TXK17062.1 bifunctional diguanylate cyclase/phosphodiesterase [Homoserinibacter sp. GY 40078]
MAVARMSRRDLFLATGEVVVAAVVVVIVLLQPQSPQWPLNVTLLLLVACTAAASAVRIRVSRAPSGQVTLGISAALLSIGLVPGSEWVTLLFWAVGMGIGWGVIQRGFIAGLRAASRSVVLGAAFVAVWLPLGMEIALPLVAITATSAYVALAVLVHISVQLVRGVRFATIMRELIVRRIIAAFALNTAIMLVVIRVRTQVLDAGPESQVELGIIISLTATTAIISAVSMLVTARDARRRLDGVFAAAEALPWPADREPFDLMREFATRALGTARVEVREVPPDPRIEIGARVRTPTAETAYLVARRQPGQSPFLDRDVQTLAAIARIGEETVRARVETMGLIEEAQTDPLTGLRNYRAFQSALTTALRAGPVAVVYLDVDNFKSINDAHGHEAGNRVLQVVAARLGRAVRPSDIVARVGGDEFVVILTEVVDLAHAERIAARITRTVSPPIDVGGGVIALTLSTGLSFSDGDSAIDAAALVEQADARMYASRGRASGGLRADVDQVTLVGEAGDTVRAAAEVIDQKLITVEYQPIVDNVLGAIIGLEALVRATHPTAGAITPSLLIHEARRTGRLDMLTDQVLDLVLRDAPRIREVAPDLAEMHVNVEVDQLVPARLLPRLEAIIGETGDMILTLEMTENSLNKATEAQLSDLRELRSAGMHFALDDFGQAYSTMLAIVQYPFDTLKVDRVLVEESPDSQKSRQVMRSLVTLSRKLGVTMVVEGVETFEERDRLASLGVRYMQGFLFGRPEPIDVLLARFAAHGTDVANATRPEL